MEVLSIIGAIILIHILAWFTPGPASVLIIRNSLLYSRTAGFWTAVGFSLANVVHIIYSIIAIYLLISFSTNLQELIKYLGVAYLTYLGLKTFFVKRKKQDNKSGNKKRESFAHMAWTGFLTNLLSPQASLFFSSIFGSLIASETPIVVIVFLAVIMPITSLCMASMWTFVFTQEGMKRFYLNYQFVINKVLGVMLLFLALLILLK